MKRTAFLYLLGALSLPLVATVAFGQDAPADPEGGDTTGSPAATGGGDSEGTDVGGAISPTSSEAAVAAPDSNKKPISVGLLLGYGIDLKSGPNPWGVGFGARGGYNLDKIYLGARFVFYLGDSESASFGGMTTKESFNIWELGIEGGYDLDVSGITLRPEIGLGIASFSVDFSGSAAGFGTSLSGSSTDVYIAPGLSVLYDVTPDVFLGLDTRFQFVFASSTGTALIFLANGGMHF